MTEDNAKHHWFRVATVALVTFIMSFLAFYVVMEMMYQRISCSGLQFKRLEKIIQEDKRDFGRLEEKMMESPFIPRMRPMIVNLVKENEEYKIIVDLIPFDSDEKGIKVDVNDKILTVSGEMDKKSFGNEKIINFTQSYYLDEDLDAEKMTKEKRGNKYIITIPFKD